VFSQIESREILRTERLVEAKRASPILDQRAYLRSERRTAACNSRSTNEQMLAENARTANKQMSLIIEPWK